MTSVTWSHGLATEVRRPSATPPNATLTERHATERHATEADRELARR
ncbi:hypothetical protein [Salinispora pacifica]|nr:hypothetical protein [Salinispora pacifica]